jgi:tRNA(fMet)-specific endonuclease VapC
VAADAYLLDTSIASIAFDAGNASHADVHRRLTELADASISICAVSLGEVEYGLQVSPGIDPERHQLVRNNLLQYQILTIDRHTGKLYGELRGELFRKYGTRDARGRLKEKRPEDLLDRTTSWELGIQENDLWIVCVSVQYNLRFVTADKMERILAAAKEVHSYERAWIWSLQPVNRTDQSQRAL